jgi:hypothetical protein
MIIRNKFNGYGFDGARLYHDPVSLSIAATQAAAASSAAAVAATAAPTLAATAAAAAPTLAATTALPGIMGGTGALGGAGSAGSALTGAGGLSTGAGGIAGTGAQTLAAASPELAANLAATGNTGILSGAPSLAPTAAGAPATLPTAATTLPPAGGTPFTPPTAAGPLPPAGGTPPPMTLEQQLAQIQANPTDFSQFPQYQQVATGPGGQTPLVESQSLAPFKSNIPSQGPAPEFMSPDVALPGKAPVAQPPFAAKPYTDPGTLARAGADQGIAQMNTMPTSELMMKPTFAQQFPLSEPSALQKGFETGLQYVKDNPISTGMGLMSAGQYMNKPEEEDKDKYKSTVDMSGFQPSVPTQRSFTPSYEYQSYAMGGPVEQMSAMNAVGANTGYPMAGINTPMYANPMAQRPEATNVVAPSADVGVGAYTGEARFASGGLSAAERREYGLSTRSQRASRNLTKAYEEMEEERQKEAMKLMGERSDPGIVPRSRTQMLSSPFSAAQAEHARLGKKSKVPVAEMPKTNLGDIDNYMDIPIDAAQGGIMYGLGGYSDGGRLLKGPGDGVSDSIPAVIGKRQPARLADGEFVVPARIVSELGNGSTEAGARKLYAMMDRVQNSRKKSIGKKKVAVNSKSDKHLPA